jgi:hypothetical protein
LDKITRQIGPMSLHHLFLTAARGASLAGLLWSVVTAIVRTRGA